MSHILVIDDNINNIDVLTAALEMEGFSISVIQDSGQIDTLIDRVEDVDLVLLDLEMPERDGYTIFEYLRSLPQFETTPIVAHSVYNNEINTVRDIGFSGFIGKPLNLDALPEQLNRIFNGQGVWEIA